MNASTPFVLEAPAASSLLSRLDLSNEENVKDADSQLRRCVSDADYARWARQWGEPAISRLRDAHFDPDDWAPVEDLNEAEKRVEKLKDAIEEADKAYDRAADELDLGPKATDKLDAIFGALSKALEV